MREKWNKSDYRSSNEGQPVVAHRIAMFDDSTYVPKLVQKAPSMRAIKNYNNIMTDLDEPRRFKYNNNNNNQQESMTINGPLNDNDGNSVKSYHRNENGLDNNQFNMPIVGHIYTTDEPYDYPTIKSSSGATFIESENGTERVDELGSTSKLVTSKMQRSCTKYYNYLEIIFCAVSIANGFGNVYRLPQAVIRGGGLPFLIAYIILSLFIGLPLLFLEIGVGQIVQEGFTKTWRAVPFFRGIGYVKLFVGCLLCVYYPIYMGLSFYYVIWLSKGHLPFKMCANVQLSSAGYKATPISGNECLHKTFLTSPFEDPTWYGTYACLLLLIWIVLLVLCIKHRKTYTKVLLILLLPTLGCLLALSIRGLMFNSNLDKLTDNVDWSLLGTSNIWYFAAVQVFFSTQIGFGVFVTNAGVLFDKANPYWTSFGYIFINLVVGILSVLTVYIYGENVTFKLSETLEEFSLLTYIYDIGSSPLLSSLSSQEKLSWLTVYYLMVIFSGFISMITIIYIILKSITIESKKRLQWWQVTLILCFLALLFCAIVSLDGDLKFVHILDYYVVGNLIMITVIVEVLSFLVFYGSKRILLDFEFILGQKLSKLWIGLWYIASIILLGLFLWGLSTLGCYFDPKSIDPSWLYIFSWSVIVISLLFILYMGLHTINDQDEYYTFIDKFKASFKSSRKWGPIDPIFRYEWVQWHSKAKDGERDFTLKRRGTKDYAHSVKKRSKKSYNPTISDISTVTGSITFRHNDQNRNAVIRENKLQDLEQRFFTASIKNDARPLSTAQQLNAFDNNGLQQDDEEVNRNDNADGYGTFCRKGPYIICNEEIEHVCHRKYDEMATEL